MSTKPELSADDRGGRKLTPQAKWNEQHPLARRAHAAVASAVKRGDMQRKPCIICGSPKADAHHPNHSEPLRVEWLCRKCHQRFHALFRRWSA